MSILKKLTEQERITKAKKIVYENVHFPNGFNKFLDALLIEQITTKEHDKELIESQYRWFNDVRTGGIKLETSEYPFGLTKSAGTVTIEGSSDSLNSIQYILERHQVEYDGKTEPEDIELKVEYHDTLNPKLWDDTNTLHKDVQIALEEATQAFYEFLDIPDLDIEDVTLTGSSANYNWTDSSDLDVHLVVDMSKLEDLAPKYFDMAKKVWNELHDIHIKNIPVEFYVQSVEEEHNSTGIYSLSDRDWVVKPKHEHPSVDNNAVKAKIDEWIKNIKEILTSNKVEVMDAFMKKLSKLRQAGLDKGGEFSTENIAFKYLRTHGYLDKLAETKIKAYDRELSVEEEELLNDITSKDDPWEDIGYTKSKPAPKPTTKTNKTKVWLNVPYAQRMSAKKFGARFDVGLRKWYIIIPTSDLHKIPSSWR